MRGKQYLMGIDIGTTTSKGVITDLEGKILASAGFEHNISHPLPDRAEHDADQVWWGEFVQVCRMLLQQSGIPPAAIAAVSCSTIYPTLLPVNRDGKPLRPGILYGIDRRALKEIELLKQEMTEEYCLRTSGNGLSTQSIAPKMLWLKKNEPEVFQETAHFLNASSYITYRLTGQYCIDHGSASLGGVPYDLRKNDWDDATLQMLGIRREQLPELVWADQWIGTITSKAAEETGLTEGTVVAPGTGDHVTESLSQGYIRPGAASISYGTTFGTDVCMDQLLTCPGISTSLTCFQGLYTLGGGMLNGCSLTRWFRNNLDSAEQPKDLHSYAELDALADQIPAGSEGLLVLPYFAGEKIPFFDAHAKGVLFGLTLHHTRSHIYRALMEGVAYSVRHTLEKIQSAGFPVQQVISTGGGCAGIWPQIVSDVTGLRQQVLQQSHGSPMGAAFLGAMVAGLITDPHQILDWNEIDRWVEPNPENRELYDRRYSVFRQLYDRTADLMGSV